MPSLWITEANNEEIQKRNESGSLITCFASPASNPLGLGYDNTQAQFTLAHTDIDTNCVYEVDETGSFNQLFSLADLNAIGVDADNCLWVSDTASGGGTLEQYNRTGSLVTSFTAVSNSTEGVAVDSTDSIWNSDFGDSITYRYNRTGSVVQSFSTTQDHFGLGIESTESLWHADATTQTSIFKTDWTGNILSSFGVPSIIRDVTTEDEPLGATTGPSIWLHDESDSKVRKTDNNLSVIKSFQSNFGDNRPNAIAYESDNCLLLGDVVGATCAVVRTNQNGSLIDSFLQSNAGLAAESNDSIWVGNGGGTQIETLDNSGSIQSSFSTDVAAPYGLTITSGGCVWQMRPNVDRSFIRFNQAGSQTSITGGPCVNSKRMGIDASESFWVGLPSTFEEVTVHDKSGSVGRTLSSPTTSLIGITTEDEPLGTTAVITSLWTADTGDKTFGVNEAGSIANSFTFTGARGIGIDTTNSLWISDDTSSPYTIEQTDQTGTTQTSFTAPSTVEDLSVDSDNSVLLVDDNDNDIKVSDQTGSIGRSFSTPSNRPRGAVLDSSNSIWVSDEANSVYQIDQNGTQQSQLAVGTNSLLGIGIDANQSLYVVDENANQSIIKIDQTGTQQSIIAAPSTEPFGLTHVDEPQGQVKPGGGSVWVAEQSGIIQQFDRTGATITSFNPPASDPAGLSNDTNDCLWNASRGSGDSVVYQTNQSGSTISSFNINFGNPEGCGIDEEECVWLTVGASIKQFDQQGNSITGFIQTQAADLNAAVFDLSDCFWVADDDNCQITQIDQNGSVTSTFNQLDSAAFGVGIDNDECIWHTDRGSGCIVIKFDQTGTVQKSFNTGMTNIFGITTEDEPINATVAPSLGAVLKTATSGVIDADSAGVIQTQQ